MATLYEAIRDNVRQGLCTTLSLAERTATLGSSFYNSVGLRGPGGSSAAAAQLWGNLAGLACNREPVDVAAGFEPPPFTGGQCPTNYIVSLTAEFTNLSDGTTSTSNAGPAVVQGPLRLLSTQVVGEPGQQTVTVIGIESTVLQSNNVSAGRSCLSGGIGCPPDGWSAKLTSTNIVRQDGQPDDCGSLPPGPPTPYDPADFTTNPTINYTDDGGNPQSFSPTIVYSPVTVAPNGELSVPVSITFEDGSSLFGDFNFSTGDISFGGGNSGGDGTGGGPAELPPDEPLSDGECLVAVRVVVTNVDLGVGRITELFSTGASPNLYVPRLATVMFRLAGESGNGWSPPVDVKTLESIVPAPPGKVLDWAVFPRLGVSLQSFALVAPCCECKE